jgi:putative endonuclease
MLIWRRRPLDRAELGRYGEKLAARFLRRNGYRILARNVRLGAYEVDIIAQDRDAIAIVEVRTRATADPILPEDTIGPLKEQHLARALDTYMYQQDDPEAYYRIDIVSVIVPDRGRPEITLFRDAVRG